MPLCSAVSLGSSPPVLVNKSAVWSLQQVNLSSFDILLIRVKSSRDRWCSTWFYFQVPQPISLIFQVTIILLHCTNMLLRRWPSGTQNFKITEILLLQNMFDGTALLSCRLAQDHVFSIVPATGSIAEHNERVHLSHRQLAKIADGCPRSRPQWNTWKTSNRPNIKKLTVGNMKEISSGWGPLLLCIPSAKKKSQHRWRLHDVIWHKVVNIEGLGKKKKSLSSVLSSRYFTRIYYSRWK